MQRRKRWIGFHMAVGCLILALFAGCGHEQKKGDVHEETEERSAAGSESDWSAATSTVLYFDADTTSEEDAGASKETRTETETTGEAESDGDKPQEPEAEESSTGSKEEVESRIEEETMQEEAMQEEWIQEEEEETVPLYYLTEEDKAEVIKRLVAMGESYGLTYYADLTESETWDSPTAIYEEELSLGREYILQVMVEYTEGAFVLMEMEGCQGFAVDIKEQPETVTGAYYEVYVYWVGMK